jgi:hypothetical protein
MPHPIPAPLPVELLLDIFIRSISDYGVTDDFLAHIPGRRLTLPLNTQFPSLEEWVYRTKTLLCLSRVSKSWFRVATPLLYETIRVYRPTMLFGLIRAASEAPLLLRHTKHLSMEIRDSWEALRTEANPDASHAFNELGSRCPNLRVFQSRCWVVDYIGCSNAFPSLRVYEGILHPLVSSSQASLQYLALHTSRDPIYEGFKALYFPSLRVLDLVQADWSDYTVILS